MKLVEIFNITKLLTLNNHKLMINANESQTSIANDAIAEAERLVREYLSEGPGNLKIIQNSPINSPEFKKIVNTQIPDMVKELRYYLDSQVVEDDCYLGNIIIVMAFIIIKLPLPGLDLDYVISHKPNTIKSMLLAIKTDTDNDEDEIGKFKIIRRVIIFLKFLGIDWPEVAIIQRSIDTIQKSPQLNEDDGQESIQSYYHDLVSDLHLWVGWPKLSSLLNIVNYALGYALQPTIVGDIFKKYKPKILKVLKEYVKLQTEGGSNYANLFYWLETVIKLYRAGCKWSELLALLEKEKVTVVRIILSIIKETDDLWLASGTVSDLRKIGVNWPEFAIIERSIEAEKQLKKPLRELFNQDELNTTQKSFQHIKDTNNAR